MKLNEVTAVNKDEILKKLRKYDINPNNVEIKNDGTVDLINSVWISTSYFSDTEANHPWSPSQTKKLEKFDVQFGVAHESFTLQSCYELRSLKGCPHRVEGTFRFSNCDNVKSLEHAPEWIGENCLLVGEFITDFGSIKYVGNRLKIEGTKIKHMLKAFDIEGVKSIATGNKILDQILNKYLPARDALGCQDELIDVGLEEYSEID